MGLLDLRTFVTHFVDKGYTEASKPCKIISSSAGTDMRQKPPNVSVQFRGCQPPACPQPPQRHHAHVPAPAVSSAGLQLALGMVLPPENITAFATHWRAQPSRGAGLSFPTQ